MHTITTISAYTMERENFEQTSQKSVTFILRRELGAETITSPFLNSCMQGLGMSSRSAYNTGVDINVVEGKHQ